MITTAIDYNSIDLPNFRKRSIMALPPTLVLVDHKKGLGRNTPVLMFDGSIKMSQDIRVGDVIMGDDSSSRIVKKTITGIDDMFEVTQIRGIKYTVTGDHILVLTVSNYEYYWWDDSRKRWILQWLENWKRRTKSFTVKDFGSKEMAEMETKTFQAQVLPTISGYTRYKDIVEIETRDYDSLSEFIQGAYKGFSVGIEFPERTVEIDPYAVGYWLGDGTAGKPEITTGDNEIREYFTNFADDLGLQITERGEYSMNITTGTRFGGAGRNPFVNFLKSYNLWNNKHIPDDYKYNSRANQLKLLAGIIDSDGTQRDNVYNIKQKCERLTDDIIFLIRSLGFQTHKKLIQCTCTNSKNGPVTGWYYWFPIYGKGLEEIPVLLNRKQCHERMTKKTASVTGITIAPVGKQIYYGFEFEGNPRFLLEDFTVAHASLVTGQPIYNLPVPSLTKDVDTT